MDYVGNPGYDIILSKAMTARTRWGRMRPVKVELNEALAKRFLQKIGRYTDYNVNIMDVNGNIIAASRNVERIGTFHEVAYRMVEGNVESMVICKENEYEGVKEGVNLLLQSRGSVLGVVGVTGEEEKVREIALIIKMSFETMISYEQQQIDTLYRRSFQEQFYMALFVESAPAQSRLEMLAKQLQIEEKCVRIAVLLRVKGAVPRDEHALRKAIPVLKEQDLGWIFDEHRLLLFYKLSDQSKAGLGKWREEVLEWLEKVNVYQEFEAAFVGSLQNRLLYYGQALKHCRWLEENSEKGKNRVEFFYQHVQRYIADLTPDMELSAIFNVYNRVLDADFKSSFMDTIGALEATNYNLAEGAKRLYLHKNTMAFRVNRIRECLEITPMHQSSDRNFASWLLYYLRQKSR